MDFTRNILPFLRDLEEDEAGPDATETAEMLGVPAKSMVVLSRNENPYGPSPLVRAALKDVPMHRYPDSRPLLEAISSYTGYAREWLVSGAGMDEIITTICRIFLGCGDSALVPVPTYNVYGLAARLCGARPIFSARLPGFAVGPRCSGASRWLFYARRTIQREMPSQRRMCGLLWKGLMRLSFWMRPMPSLQKRAARRRERI